MAAIVITVFSAVAWVTALLRLDPHRARKRVDRSMMTLFVLGMLSAAPAYVLSSILPLDPRAAPPGLSLAIFVFVYAPVEELSKLLLFSLLVTRLRSLREPADGVYQAAAVGLGFAVVENVLYGAWYGPEIALIRATITPLRHMIYAAAWGLAYSTQRFGRSRLTSRGLAVVVLAVLPASLVHGFSNFLAGISFGAQALFGLAMAASALALLSRLKRSSPYAVGDLRRPGQALRTIQRALVHDPANRHLHLRAAHFRIRGGDPRQAVAHLRAVSRGQAGRSLRGGAHGSGAPARRLSRPWRGGPWPGPCHDARADAESLPPQPLPSPGAWRGPAPGRALL